MTDNSSIERQVRGSKNLTLRWLIVLVVALCLVPAFAGALQRRSAAGLDGQSSLSYGQ